MGRQRIGPVARILNDKPAEDDRRRILPAPVVVARGEIGQRLGPEGRGQGVGTGGFDREGPAEQGRGGLILEILVRLERAGEGAVLLLRDGVVPGQEDQDGRERRPHEAGPPLHHGVLGDSTMSVRRTEPPGATTTVVSYARKPSRVNRRWCVPGETARSVLGVFPTAMPSR